jgi:hypothetical protein
MKCTCPRCGSDSTDTRLGRRVLLNPAVWLFSSPVDAPDLCSDCVAPLTLFGIAAVFVLSAAIFVVLVIR